MRKLLDKGMRIRTMCPHAHLKELFGRSGSELDVVRGLWHNTFLAMPLWRNGSASVL